MQSTGLPVPAFRRAHRPAFHTASLPPQAMTWKQEGLVLNTNMRWVSAKEASRAVNDYAFFVQRKRARMDKKTSGGRNKKYVCSCTHCGWFVRLIKVAKSENWKISSMQLMHSHDCTGQAQPTARQLAEMHAAKGNGVTMGASDASGRESAEFVVKRFKPGVQELRAISNGDSIGSSLAENNVPNTRDFVQEAADLGVRIPARLAYRAKKILMQKSASNSNSLSTIIEALQRGKRVAMTSEIIIESYKLLPSLLQKFSDRNPGSAVCLKKDERGRFKCAFIMPKPVSDLLSTLQQVYALEIVPCSSSPSQQVARTKHAASRDADTYSGYLVVFMGRDGNWDPRMIAFGLIPQADAIHLSWFLRSLETNQVVLSDHVLLVNHTLCKAMGTVRNEFPAVYPLFTVEGIFNSLVEKFPQVSNMSMQYIRDRLEKACVVDQAEHFNCLLDEIESVLPAAAGFVRKIDPADWAVHANEGIRTYQWTNSGLREFLRADLSSSCTSQRLEDEEIDEPALHTNGSTKENTSMGSAMPGFTLEDIPLMAPFEIIYLLLLYFIQTERERKAKSTLQIATASSSGVHSSARSSIRLTPAAERIVRSEMFLADHITVTRCENHIGITKKRFASSHRGGEHCVDLKAGTCTCTAIRQLGLPCRHLIATARAFHDNEAVVNSCDPIYFMSNYKKSVQDPEAVGSIEQRVPCVNDLSRDASILPPSLSGSSLSEELKPATISTDQRILSKKKKDISPRTNIAAIHVDETAEGSQEHLQPVELAHDPRMLPEFLM